MGRTKALIPERRYHVSGQSVVTISGKNFYLGPHDEALTIARYACLIQAYQSNGYRLPDEFSIEDVRRAAGSQFGELLSNDHADEPVKVKHLAEAYKAYIEKRYANSMQDRVRRLEVADWLLKHDAALLVERFGPRKLREYRDRLATGMRPSEVCAMKPCDIDRKAEFWIFRPKSHKTAWKGIEREIPLVGEARAVIENYLNRKADSYCFSPAESMAWHRAKQSSERKGYGSFKKPVESPKKTPGDHYEAGSFRQAIARAAKMANVPHWTPYQIRHLVGTTVAESLQLESSKALLGHQDLRTTQIYSQTTTKMAIEAAHNAPTMRGDK
jgi:integrase